MNDKEYKQKVIKHLNSIENCIYGIIWGILIAGVVMSLLVVILSVMAG